jgi:hypothetical protein
MSQPTPDGFSYEIPTLCYNPGIPPTPPSDFDQDIIRSARSRNKYQHHMANIIGFIAEDKYEGFIPENGTFAPNAGTDAEWYAKEGTLIVVDSVAMFAGRILNSTEFEGYPFVDYALDEPTGKVLDRALAMNQDSGKISPLAISLAKLISGDGHSNQDICVRTVATGVLQERGGKILCSAYGVQWTGELDAVGSIMKEPSLKNLFLPAKVGELKGVRRNFRSSSLVAQRILGVTIVASGDKKRPQKGHKKRMPIPGKLAVTPQPFGI